MRKIVEAMAGTTDATVHLANRLLALARIEHRTQEDASALVSLTAIARQVGLDLAPQAAQKNINLSLDAGEEVLVRADAAMLRELASNLVDNAIRYTPGGGSVAVRVFAQAGAAHLEVEDSGPGIAPDERAAVFTPFYRSGATMDSNPEGTGLGLAIVREIASLYGASVELDAAAGGGLLVRVRLPLATAG
jgi:two-component system sensor histidine kinase TctE